MQLHEVQPKTKQRKSRRVGRGGKKGTYSGRGMKGQGARAGAKFQPRVREILKRYPKLRGYKRAANSGQASLNTEVLEKHFAEGEIVNPTSLVAKRIVGTINGRPPAVKILGRGELTKAFTIEGCSASKGAKEKIEKAGGKIQ